VDKFSGDLADEVARLRAEVKELREMVRARPATTSASLGWRMADMGIPTVGPGEIQIGSNGGDLFVATESGTKRLPNLPGAAPDYPGSFTSPATIGSDPTAANYNALRADIVTHLHGPLRDLIEKGRVTGGSGLWLP
jgi:hypothetical protein